MHIYFTIYCTFASAQSSHLNKCQSKQKWWKMWCQHSDEEHHRQCCVGWHCKTRAVMLCHPPYTWKHTISPVNNFGKLLSNIASHITFGLDAGFCLLCAVIDRIQASNILSTFVVICAKNSKSLYSVSLWSNEITTNVLLHHITHCGGGKRNSQL